MGVYDSSKDEVTWETEVDITNPFSKSSFKQKFIVRVMRYDGGLPKLDINRLVYGHDNKGRYLKRGRFSKSELEVLLPVIQEAMEKM